MATDAFGNVLIKFVNIDGSNQTYSIPTSGFNDLRTINLTPMVGWTFNYNINSDYISSTTANGGTVTQSNSMAVLSTSTAINGNAKISTRKSMRYSPGLGALVRFTSIFTTGVADSRQIIGLGDTTDGFFFGFNGANFSILRASNGTPNWVAQINWNYDTMDGFGPSGMTLDPTKGNVYSINYQWLGYGIISYYIENTTTGQPILVHRIEYPNTTATPSVYNPTFPITAMVDNLGNSTNLVLQTPSAMAFCEGDGFSQAIVTRNAINASVSLTTPTNANVLTIRNKSSFASKTNRAQILIDTISCSAEGANTVRFKLIRNATFGTALSYTNISTNTSVVEYSASTSSVTGGTLLLAFEIGINKSTQLIISSLDLNLIPGDTLSLQATSSNNTQLDCSMSWRELW